MTVLRAPRAKKELSKMYLLAAVEDVAGGGVVANTVADLEVAASTVDAAAATLEVRGVDVVNTVASIVEDIEVAVEVNSVFVEIITIAKILNSSSSSSNNNNNNISSSSSSSKSLPLLQQRHHNNNFIQHLLQFRYFTTKVYSLWIFLAC